MRFVTLKTNKKGFSLMEVVIAATITVIVGAIITQSVLSTQKMSQQIEKDLDFKVDALLTDKIVLKDFRNISPSLNQLMFDDDQGLPFFDYEPDRVSAFYKGQVKKTRELTLGIGAKKDMYVLVQDSRRGHSVFTDPISAYTVGPTPPDISTPSSLSFVGFNSSGFLSAKNPKLLDVTGLLAIDSAAFMPVSALNPRRKTAMYVGFPNAQGNVAHFNFPGGIFDPGIYTPAGTKVSISSLDTFLQNLPSLGSVGSSVRIQPVKFLKYEAVCDKDKCRFYRYELEDSSGKFGKQMLMNAEAKQMKVKRSDIATTIFHIEFVKPDRKIK